MNGDLKIYPKSGYVVALLARTWIRRQHNESRNIRPPASVGGIALLALATCVRYGVAEWRAIHTAARLAGGPTWKPHGNDGGATRCKTADRRPMIFVHRTRTMRTTVVRMSNKSRTRNGNIRNDTRDVSRHISTACNGAHLQEKVCRD
jgi:hypothetical protein